MKKKSIILIVSACLNLVLLAAVAYSIKFNSRAEHTAAPVFLVQSLPEVVLAQNPSLNQKGALASIVK